MLLIDFKSVHVVLATFVVRIDIVLRVFNFFASETILAHLSLLQVIIERFVPAIIIGHFVELELDHEEFFDLLCRI